MLHIKSPSLVEEKLTQFQADGPSKLHIVSDFDRTLTKCYDEKGERVPSSISLIRRGNYLSPKYVQAAYDLFDKYNPIELDETLDLKFRKQKMDEWWQAHMQLLVDSGMNQAVIDDIVTKNPRLFREGTLEFFAELASAQIPILIFSAGQGNIIQEHLANNKAITPNLHLLSNSFDFNEEGVATGYNPHVIHVLNKSERDIEIPEYLNIIKDRRNIILLGDSIGDLGMAEKLENNTLLTIGFLNEKVEERLSLFMDKFDVVITGDGNMDYVRGIVQNIKQT